MNRRNIKNRLLGYILSIALLGAFLIWLRQSPLGSSSPFPQRGCDTHATFLDSEDWQVSSSNVSVRTLWQKTEERPILQEFNGGGLAVLPDRVVFYSEFWEKSSDAVLPSCTEQEIVAFDLLTGTLEWRYPLSEDYSRPYNGLYALSDGVVIVLDGILIKFDSDGQYVWSNEGFPSRSINIVYRDQNNLYLPSNGKFYVVSNETGQRLQPIDTANPISVLDGNIVSAVDENHLQVLLAGSQERLEIPVNDPALIQGAWFDPFTDIAGDILFVYDLAWYRRSSIEAYSLVDGNLLWRLVDDFNDMPVISNNHLYIYENHSIRVIDVSTGNQIGTIDLTAIGERQLNLSPHEVLLAAYEDILIVNIRDTWDIIALEIEPET